MGGLRYNEGESFIVIRKDGAGMNFTPEQQSAIDAKNRELLVSAAAGSSRVSDSSAAAVRLISFFTGNTIPFRHPKAEEPGPFRLWAVTAGLLFAAAGNCHCGGGGRA